jgi:3-hydroxybutyryl-CoA dehydratase
MKRSPLFVFSSAGPNEKHLMENRRFQNLPIGSQIPPVIKKMTQEIINGWAQVSTDFNPLHVDPEYAKKTKFGSTIAHGQISIAYLNELMTNWLGEGWVCGGKLIGIKFLKPIKPGDRIIAKGEVFGKTIKDGLPFIECKVYIENQNGETVVSGKAIGRFIEEEDEPK